ncbi:MAG: hypothetical protein HY855_06950 [Burkholderiales bacterium]|nr:hypothetical protein [Burkholderiales bacterium]
MTPEPSLARGARAAPGIALRDLSLEAIDALLSSDAHYQATPTRNYGPHDPVRDAPRFILPCGCGGGPATLVFDFPNVEQLARQGGGPPGEPRRRHFVACEACGHRGRSTAQDWYAVIEWNRELCSAAVPYESFPFFNLAGLDVATAQDRVKAIRHDLELRKAQARLRSEAGIETGRRYRERIEAYLGWTMAAASLLKAHARAQRAMATEA